MNTKKAKPIGRTIKICRKYNGLTQRELGKRLGFPANSASTRIAQYESQNKTAASKIATKLAKQLGIHKYAISKLSIDSELETLHTLFKIDMVYGLNWNKNGDTVSLSFPDDCTTINRYLKKVYEARQALIKGEITYEDYVYIQNACGTYKKKEG
ncbi:MAG: helix-turn-helix domain-containing protein [Ruminococcus sp.]